MSRWIQMGVVAAVAVVALTATAGVAFLAGRDDNGAHPVALVAPASPTAPDYDREACHGVTVISDDPTAAFDWAVMSPIAADAALATDATIKATGLAMTEVYAYGTPSRGEEALKASQLVVDLADACAAKYGDDTW